jgi:primosomal protein N' (replication factor Y)
MSSNGSSADHKVASVVPLVPAWRLDRAFDYEIPHAMVERVRVGVLVRVPLGHRRVRGIVVSVHRQQGSERALEPIAAVVLDTPICPPPLTKLAEWIARRYVAPAGLALARFVPPRVRAKGAESDVGSGPEPRTVARYTGGTELLDALAGATPGAWCFRCLPTADRGRLIAELVGATKSAGIVVVPEVRFGSEIVDRLSDLVPGLVRVDSAVSDGERAAGWIAMGRGHRLAAGGRAAVLAPAPDLGLIVVVDDDHPSLKDERSPRFEARRVAMERARLQEGICVILGATPSLEVAGRARSGDLGYVRPQREDERAARPVVEVVEPPEDRALSRPLFFRIRDALSRGERVGILAPARGYARALWCAACRQSLRCPVCERGLFVDPQRVRCARCGFTAKPPDVCPSCGGMEWKAVGAGSERLAEQLQAMFPRTRVARGDDTGVRVDADLYVTTWAGTKPEVRPRVSLVGVLDADALLRRPDWRAAEAAHAALVEMGAWAGPADRGGRLVVQSSESAHHAIQAVVRADYEFFAERELQTRRELGYPPYSELIRATGPRAVIEEASAACRHMGARVLGPIPAPPPASGFEILVKCTDAMPVADRLRGILAAKSDAKLRVDVDPR